MFVDTYFSWSRFKRHWLVVWLCHIGCNERTAESGFLSGLLKTIFLTPTRFKEFQDAKIFLEKNCRFRFLPKLLPHSIFVYNAYSHTTMKVRISLSHIVGDIVQQSFGMPFAQL